MTKLDHQELVAAEYDSYKTKPVLQDICREVFGAECVNQESSFLPSEIISWLSEIDLPARASVLDLGCGRGGLTVSIAKNFPELTFAGLDASCRAIELAAKNADDLSNCSFYSGDLERPDFQDHSFDALLSLGSTYWIQADRIETVVRRWKALLKPKGMLLIVLMQIIDADDINASAVLPSGLFTPLTTWESCITAQGFVVKRRDDLRQTFHRWLTRWLGALSHYEVQIHQQFGTQEGNEFIEKFVRLARRSESGKISRYRLSAELS